MWLSVVMLQSHLHQLYLIAISCDGFTWFKQFIINYTQLIPLNEEQKAQTMNKYCCKCWCMVMHKQWSMFRVIVVYPLFIADHNTMQNFFSILLSKQQFTCNKMLFNVSWLQLMQHPMSLFLNHSKCFQTFWKCCVINSEWFCKFSLHFTWVII